MCSTSATHLQLLAQLVDGSALGQLDVAGGLHAARHGHEVGSEADGHIRPCSLRQALQAGCWYAAVITRHSWSTLGECRERLELLQSYDEASTSAAAVARQPGTSRQQGWQTPGKQGLLLKLQQLAKIRKNRAVGSRQGALMQSGHSSLTEM